MQLLHVLCLIKHNEREKNCNDYWYQSLRDSRTLKKRYTLYNQHVAIITSNRILQAHIKKATIFKMSIAEVNHLPVFVVEMNFPMACKWSLRLEKYHQMN